MLTSAEIDYVADGYIEVHKVVGTKMNYVPLDRVATKKDKTGKLVFVFKEASKIEVYGIYSSDEDSDPDVDVDGERRTDGKIKLVIKQLNGYIPQTQDVIDVINPDGLTYERYLITGFDKKIELNYIFVRAIVTKFSKAFTS
jgi:hypothetical protein